MPGKLIGKGRTADVLEFGNNKVIKLFNQDISRKDIEFEFNVNNIAGIHQCSVPEVFEITEFKGKTGIVFEKITGQTVFDLLGNNILKAKKIAEQTAKIHLDIHKAVVPGLKNQKEDLKIRIKKASQLSENYKNKIIDYLYNLPDNDKLCHGDFHPDNIIACNNKYYVIDWINACSGDPACDVSRAMLIIQTPFIKSIVPKYKYHLLKVIISVYKSHFLKTYIQNSSVTMNNINKWILPVAAARLCENVPLESNWLLDIITKEFTGI